MSYSSNSNVGGYGGGGPAQWGSPDGYPASCTGDIKVTCKWFPDEPGAIPPPSVIVAEFCTAQVQCSHSFGSAYTNTCDNGLGFAPVKSTFGSPFYPSDTITSTGWRYSIKQNPGQSFTLTCSPNASLAGPFPNLGSDGGQGTVSVSYGVSVTTLDVVLSGGIGPQDKKRYLIGQLCSASLTNANLTASNYNWNVSGGDPFADWVADKFNGNVTPLDPGLASASGYQCHFKTPNAAPTVTCTVDLAVPPGAHPVGGFSGVTVSQTLATDRPGFGLSVYMDAVVLNPDTPPYGRVHLGGSTQPVGIDYEGEANTPKTPSDYVTPYSDYGNWELVQMVTTMMTEVVNGQPMHNTMNGIPCLDTTYPLDGLTWTSNGRDGSDNDSPWQILLPGTTTLNRLDSFRDWQMYLPPGAGSAYVPLLKIKWYWNAEVQWFAPDNKWHLMSSPGDCAWGYDGGPFPEFPHWNSNIASGQIVNGS